MYTVDEFHTFFNREISRMYWNLLPKRNRSYQTSQHGLNKGISRPEKGIGGTMTETIKEMSDEDSFEKWYATQLPKHLLKCYTGGRYIMTILKPLSHKAAFAAGQAAAFAECAEIAEGCMSEEPINEIDEEWDNACSQIVNTIRRRTNNQKGELKMTPETITIDAVKYVREDLIKQNELAPIICQDDVVAPWILGKIYLIRTVTMIDTGILVAATDKELVLEEAAWIADTGRFSDAIAKAEFSEVEPFPKGRVILNRACVIDAVEITKLQRSKK